MPVEFSCHECQTKLRVDDQDIQKKVRCPKCGMIQFCPNAQQRNSREPQSSQEIEGLPNYDRKTAYLPTASVAEKSTESQLENAWLLKTPDDSTYGPVDQATLVEWAKQGRVSSQCLVRREADAHWQSALSLMPNLADLKPRSIPPQPRADGSTMPHTIDPASPRENHGTWIFICSLFGFFGPAVLLSLVAIIWGPFELLNIKNGNAKSNNKAFIICGIMLGGFKLLEMTIHGSP